MAEWETAFLGRGRACSALGLFSWDFLGDSELVTDADLTRGRERSSQHGRKPQGGATQRGTQLCAEEEARRDG